MTPLGSEMGLSATMQEFMLQAERAAKQRGRDVSAALLVWRDAVQFYDREYGMILGEVSGDLIRNKGYALRDAVWNAMREPTSLELLTFAQLTGPHVGGA